MERLPLPLDLFPDRFCVPQELPRGRDVTGPAGRGRTKRPAPAGVNGACERAGPAHTLRLGLMGVSVATF